MKKLLILAGCFLSFSCFAATPIDSSIPLAQNCPIADPSRPDLFCKKFREAAKCYCDTIFPGRCPTDMNALYQLMMTGHKNLEDACRFQEPITHLPARTCVDHWNKFHELHC